MAFVMCAQGSVYLYTLVCLCVPHLGLCAAPILRDIIAMRALAAVLLRGPFSSDPCGSGGGVPLVQYLALL